jgi:hypothetical protein
MGDLNPNDFKLLNVIKSATDLTKTVNNNSEAFY